MIYWFILILIILFQWNQKKDNIFYLKLAFYIFLSGAAIRIIGLSEVAEFFIRISFIFWIVGLAISIRKFN